MYYIAPADSRMHDVIIYTLKKRISDFKADDDVQYVVYRNKKEMQEGSGWFPYYTGKNGKLKKSKTEGFMRFGGWY